MLGGASVICGSRERYDTFVCSIKISSHIAFRLKTSTVQYANEDHSGCLPGGAW